LGLLADESSALLERITNEGAAKALAQIGFVADESITDQLNQYALDYANDRAAEMIGMKMKDGERVPNPNAEWVISDTTRDMVKDDIADAIETGMSNDELADNLSEMYAFSDARAETIARTETAKADIGGNLEAYRVSGQVASKRWITGEGCCDECEALNGMEVDLDDDFPDVGDPPAHPNCRCDVLPVLSDISGDD
jgi:SPP1 gp7 family putative phage head morphogenesis protein